MSRPTIAMTITGPGVEPEHVGLGDLADVLARLDRSFASYVEGMGIEVPEGSRVSLVAINRSSEQLVLSVDPPYLAVVAGIASVVSGDGWQALPDETYRELEELSSMLAKRDWTLRIEHAPDHGVHAASLGAEKPVPGRPRAVRLDGTTSLHARCLRVGGVQPRAELRLPGTGKLLYADLSEDVAKDLAARLYDEVVLEGRATWNAETWEIEAFRVLRVTSYRKTDPTLVFKELAEAAQGQWDAVDAAAYVRALRSEA